MTNFDADILYELRDLQEVAIRTEKHPNTAVVIWVAVAAFTGASALQLLDRAPSFRPSSTPCDQTVSVGIREGRE